MNGSHIKKDTKSGLEPPFVQVNVAYVFRYFLNYLNSSKYLNAKEHHSQNRIMTKLFQGLLTEHSGIFYARSLWKKIKFLLLTFKLRSHIVNRLEKPMPNK